MREGGRVVGDGQNDSQAQRPEGLNDRGEEHGF